MIANFIVYDFLFVCWRVCRLFMICLFVVCLFARLYVSLQNVYQTVNVFPVYQTVNVFICKRVHQTVYCKRVYM